MVGRALCLRSAFDRYPSYWDHTSNYQPVAEDDRLVDFRWLRSYLDLVEGFNVFNCHDWRSGDSSDAEPSKVAGEALSLSKPNIGKRVESKVSGDNNQVLMPKGMLSNLKSAGYGKLGSRQKGVMWFLKVSSQKMALGKGKGKMVHFATFRPKLIPRSNKKISIGKHSVRITKQSFIEDDDSSTSEEEMSRWAFAFQGLEGRECSGPNKVNLTGEPNKEGDANK
ncbi:hypothetical protein LWI28_011497 [Acer negundo]|uniref:Uncharacterized protein n=1 Tax=Acer negundo TaxID=4023 RepID=A0AAD5J0G7_ACENE|nr:hypothetical protein LWI28_011497 [Acer negundo]